MIKKISVILFLFWLSFFYVNGQLNRELIIDVPINRFEPSKYLMPYIKYIENEPDISTGIPSISVNLFQDNGESLDMIYNASGIMAEEKASYIGLGWFLNVGGVITRVVRDLPDDMTKYGYINNSSTSKLLANYNSCTANQADVISNNDGYDYEPDIFYFYTKDFRGKFMISKDGTVNTFPKSNFDISFKKDANGKILSFKIIPPGGAKYIFDVGETATVNANGRSFNYTSGWRLMKLETHGDNSLIANMRYVKAAYSESRLFAKYSISDEITSLNEKELRYNIVFQSNIIPRSYGTSTVQMTFDYVNQIIDPVNYKYNMPNEGNANFPYVDSEGKLISFNQNSPIVLKNIKIDLLKNPLEYNIIIGGVENVSPTYIDNFLVPDIKIKKAFNNKEVELGTKFSYYHKPEISREFVFCQDYWGYLSTSTTNNLIPKSGADETLLNPMYIGSDKVLNGTDRFAKAYSGYSFMLKDITSYDGNVVKYEYEPNSFIFNGQAYLGGGVRICKKSLFNINNLSKAIDESYSYKIPNSVNSSGILISFPYSGEKLYDSFGSNAFFRIGYSYRGVTHDGVKPVFYKYVTVSKEGSGSVRYQFELPVDAIAPYQKLYDIQNSFVSKKVAIRSNGYKLGNLAMGAYNKGNINVLKNLTSNGQVVSEVENEFVSNFDKTVIKGFRRNFHIIEELSFINNTGGGNNNSLLLPSKDDNFIEGDRIAREVASVMFYNETTVCNRKEYERNRILNNGNAIESITRFEYTSNKYKLPFRKAKLQPNGDKLVEQIMYSGSYNNRKQESIANLKSELNDCIDRSNHKSELVLNEENGKWVIKDPEFNDDTQYCYDNYSNGLANLGNPIIFEMQQQNNITSPVESLVYIEKPNGIKYLLSADVSVYKKMKYIDRDPYEFIRESKTAIPYKHFKINGPIKWTPDIYKESYVDINNKIFIDSTKMITLSEITRVDKNLNVIEFKDQLGVYNSFIYDILNNIKTYEAKNCKWDKLKEYSDKSPYNRKPEDWPNGATISQYCYLNNIWTTQIINHNTNTSTYYAYDLLNRVVAVFDNDKNIIQYTKRNRIGLSDVPIVCNEYLGGFNYYTESSIENWKLHNFYNGGTDVTVDGNVIKEPKFLFSGAGKHIVKQVSVSEGVVWRQSETTVNVTEDPFKFTTNLFIRSSSSNFITSTVYPNTPAAFYLNNNIKLPAIEYSITGGSGDYEVVVYKECTSESDLNNRSELPTINSSWVRINTADDYNNFPGKITGFQMGKNKFYLWFLDKRKPGYVANSTPDIRTAHIVYNVEFKGDSNVILDPNPKTQL
ncbi:MAG: hypothetical protein JXA53_07470 [Bacteroidales bacterium]|nr:hypothetical protein [Bacteroidales bacterium]